MGVQAFGAVNVIFGGGYSDSGQIKGETALFSDHWVNCVLHKILISVRRLSDDGLLPGTIDSDFYYKGRSGRMAICL